MQHNCCLYSQHTKGIHNNVADALSRLHHYSPNDLQHRILLNYPSQVPPTFHIAPLPQEISSWMISWLQNVKEPTESDKEQKIRKTECGKGGVNTAESLTTSTIHSRRIYLQNSEPDCSEPSPPLYAQRQFSKGRYQPFFCRFSA